MRSKKGSKSTLTEKNKSEINRINEMFFWLFFILVGMVIFRFFLFQAVVEGESMAPTLSPGDVVWVKNKNVSKIERGSVVLFDNPFGKTTDSWYNIGDMTDFETPVRYVKRVVGLPGDTIQYGVDKVVINGKEHYNRGYATVEGQKMYEVTLGSDELFVLGDNQEFSLDSRSFGPIKRSTIIGEMIQLPEEIDDYFTNYYRTEEERLTQLRTQEALQTVG